MHEIVTQFSPKGPPNKLPKVNPIIMTEPIKCLFSTFPQTKLNFVVKVSVNSEVSKTKLEQLEISEEKKSLEHVKFDEE